MAGGESKELDTYYRSLLFFYEIINLPRKGGPSQPNLAEPHLPGPSAWRLGLRIILEGGVHDVTGEELGYSNHSNRQVA